MRNLKKILALVLALMMVLSVMVTASAAFEDADQINPAYEQAVEVMAAAGILNGTGNGFEPTKTLTRAQAAKLIAYLATAGNVAGIVPCETVFDDVATSNGVWASGFIAYCYENGIINGVSDTEFAPDANITVEAYAKLLLGVLGVEGTYTGDKWYVAVRNNAIAKKLMAGMTGYSWTAELTREEAAQMTYNAMLADAETKTVVVGGYYVVDEIKFASAAEAYFYAQGQAEPKPTVEYVPAEEVDVQVTALLTAFDIEITSENDPYGAPATKVVVNANDEDEDNDVTLYYAEAEDFIYTAATDAKVIAKDMKGYILAVNGTTTYKVEADSTAKFTNAATGIVAVDGVAKANLKAATDLATDEAVTASAILAALTDNNAVVRIYTNKDKVITNIVVTNTYFAAAGEITEADEENETPEMIDIDGTPVVNALGLFEGEYVTYTVCGEKIENVAKADYVIGTLSSYNSKTDSYVINDTAYTVVEGVEVDVAAVFADAHVFYVGANNTILGIVEELPTAEAPADPDAPVLPTDYVVIDAVAAKVVTGTVAGDLWNADVEVVTDVLAQIKAYTSNGTYEVFDLEITKATADIKNNAGVVQVAKNAWYTVVAGAYYTLPVTKEVSGEVEGETVTEFVTDIEMADAIVAILTADAHNDTVNVYPYAVEDGVITLYTKLPVFSNNESTSGTYVRKLKNSASISASSLYATVAGSHKVLINETTTYLLNYDPTEEVGDEYVADTTALAGTVIAGDSTLVIVDVVVTKDKDNNKVGQTNTAKYVFAIEDTYNAGEAPQVPVGTEMVYVDASDYTLTEIGEETNTYIYNVIKTDGTTAQLKYIAAEELDAEASGIYLLKTDGSLGTKVSGQKAATVELISGTTAKIGSDYVIVNDNTTVVGEFAVGAEVLYIVYTVEGQSTSVVNLLYVTKDAE